MKRLKTAVVGVGSLGKHHLKWLSQLPESDLVGLYDIDSDRGEQFAKQYEVTSFDSIESLADKVDVAVIAAPTSAHHELAMSLIERGVHLLIEKPITNTLKQAKELVVHANKKEVLLTVGQIERFNPAIRALSLDDLRPSFVEAHRLASFDPRGTDVAVVLDLMIHDIDLVLMLIRSTVVDIQASAVSVISDHFDIANARLTFDNGAVANLTASRISLQPMRKMRIFQRSGYYSLDLARKQADLYSLSDKDDNPDGLRIPLGKSGRDVVYRKRTDDGSDMLASELQHFLRAVLNDEAPAVSAEDATEALRIALEVERIGTERINLMLEHAST